MTRRKDEPLKNVAASVKARLLKLARSAGEDFNALVTRYVLERLLFRLASTSHSDDFVLKGALLFVVWSGRPHRATKDVDLLGYGTPDLARLEGVFREICRSVVPDDGVVFLPETVKAEAIREDAVYDGIRLRFTAMLGTGKVPVQVDVGFGDATTPVPTLTELPTLLDYPAPKLRAYARESTIAEKLHALVHLGLGNSRMKDYYDLWFLSEFYSYDAPTLVNAVRATFEKRGTAFPEGVPVGLTAEFSQDADKLKQWQAFLRRSRLQRDPPELDAVVMRMGLFLLPMLAAARRNELGGQSWSAGGGWQ